MLIYIENFTFMSLFGGGFLCPFLQCNQWCVLQLHGKVFNNCSSEIHTLVVNLQPCVNPKAKMNNLTQSEHLFKNDTIIKRSLKTLDTCGRRHSFLETTARFFQWEF